MRIGAACLLLALAVLSAVAVDTVGGQNTTTTTALGKPLRYPPPPPSPNATTVTLIGELKFVDTHDGNPRYALYNADGNVTPFAHGYQQPAELEYTSTPISPGDVIELECVLGRPGYCGACPNGESETCTCPTEDDNIQACTITRKLVVIIPASASFGPEDPQQGTALNINYRLLVIILNYSACGFAPSLDVDTVTKLYMGPNRDGNGGVAEKFKQCSYGKFNIRYFHAAVVQPACSTAITSGCSWWAISSGADAAAKAQLGLPFFSNFTYYTYVVPPGLQSVCKWAGLSVLPGKQTWLQSTGNLRWATIMQGTIHNFGLYHSWRNGWEYEDNSTPMGRGDTCPNAAEISRLGWATAAAGGGEVNTGVLTAPGTYVTWTLPATYITGDNNYLRVVPNWMPTYGNNTLAKHLYIALRVPKAGDVGMSSTYSNRVHIHEVNATMDYGFPVLFTFSDRKIQIIDMILPNTRQVLPGYNLVVSTGALTSSDTIQVSLCRYEASDSECSPPSPPSPPPQSPSMPSPEPSPPFPKPLKPSRSSPKPPSPKPPPRKPPSPKPPPRKPPSPKPPPHKPPPPKIIPI
ncbi:hypothetical protein Vafri_6156 [Volvox africanus]|uniref:Peptidase M11 gametolysin domain-containing protein n=1 Tax=Volvox africanus TaxID=51714 RepID=A0A8J4B1W0_9CHLO|nr:hypothetical protein Vafri_6156 [Volvox africanus]